jgi:hypothetical protein
MLGNTRYFSLLPDISFFLFLLNKLLQVKISDIHLFPKSWKFFSEVFVKLLSPCIAIDYYEFYLVRFLDSLAHSSGHKRTESSPSCSIFYEKFILVFSKAKVSISLHPFYNFVLLIFVLGLWLQLIRILLVLLIVFLRNIDAFKKATELVVFRVNFLKL